MNVRDPFNLRNSSLNRPPIATWKSNRTYHAAANPNLSPLHHIIRTAATATQSAAADLRDKAGEVVQSAQQVLAEAAATTTLDIEKATQPEAEKKKPPPPQQQPKPTPPPNPSSQRDKGKDQDKDMSFAVPKNVPSFSNPHRQLEDHLWAASSSSSSSRQRPSAGGAGSTASSVINGVQDLLGARGNRAALPMYKDKPYMYPPGRGGPQAGWRRPVYRRKRTCGFLLLVIAGLVWWTGMFAGQQELAVTKLNDWGWLNQEEKAEKGTGKVDWLQRRERVVEAMELSWAAYERHAWGGLFPGNPEVGLVGFTES
jgi:mannosyl-oligosaccharide alpha-1,2-mannosidase